MIKRVEIWGTISREQTRDFNVDSFVLNNNSQKSSNALETLATAH